MDDDWVSTVCIECMRLSCLRKFTPDEPSIATAMLEPVVQKRWLVRAAVTQADLALALEDNAQKLLSAGNSAAIESALYFARSIGLRRLVEPVIASILAKG